VKVGRVVKTMLPRHCVTNELFTADDVTPNKILVCQWDKT